ncbi:MAG: MarR family transcriptional regulator [Staphylococcus epidermidis]|nr:MarR family transcriptional regulator [Staphylococcus epidermidis]
MLNILTNEFFNSFIGIYRPYIKLTQPILDQHQIHTGQWLVLRDIANYQPTTLVKISHRRSIEKPTITVIQQDIIKKTGLTDEQVFDITNAMSQIHEAMIKEEQ